MPAVRKGAHPFRGRFAPTGDSRTELVGRNKSSARGRLAPTGDSRTELVGRNKSSARGAQGRTPTSWSVSTDRHFAHRACEKELLNRPAYKTRGAYLAFISEESEATAGE